MGDTIMPQLTMHIKEANNRIFIPIARQALTNILMRCGLADLFGDNKYIRAPGMANEIYLQDGRVNIGDDRVDMDITYNLTGSEVLYPAQTEYGMPSNGIFRTGIIYNTANYGTTKNDNNPFLKINRPSIFQDNGIGVSIQEYTQPSGFTATLTFKTNTWDSSYKVFNMMNSVYNDGVTINHDFTMSYPIGFPLFAILMRIYKIKSGKDKIEQDEFVDYVQRHCQTYFSFNVRKMDVEEAIKLKKKNPNKPLPNFHFNIEPIIVRHIKNAIEQTTIDNGAPEEVKGVQEVNAYQIAATTKFQFNIPRFLIVNLPVAIYNTPLPDSIFANVNAANSGSFFDVQASYSIAGFDSMVKTTQNCPSHTAPIARFPKYDDWYPPYTVHRASSYRPLIFAVYTIDESTDDYPTIKLDTDFHDYQLSDFVKEILKLHTREDMLNGTGLFRVEIYSNDTPLDNSLIDYDPDTFTVTFKTRYLKTVYRVVLSECMNFHTIDRKWYPVIVKYRYYFPMTIIRNVDALIKQKVLTITPPDELFKFITYLKKTQQLDKVIKRMVELGFAPNGFFQFTQSANQFADYISTSRIMTCQDVRNKNPVTNNLPDQDYFHVQYYLTNPVNGSILIKPDDSDYFDKTSNVTLLEIFTKICVDMKLLDPDIKFTPRLFYDSTFLHMIENGNRYAYNAPLRIINATISKAER